MAAPERFRTLRPWLLETFGRPVHRVALDAGSTCPNRDGTRGFGGCFYCDVEGSGTGALRTGEGIGEQLERGIDRVARRDAGGGVIAYLQSYSNTYVELGRLAEVLESIRPRLARGGTPSAERPVLAVAVATRPDTLPENTLAELTKLAEDVPVWLELGLETADDRILLEINRLHTRAEFLDACERAHGAGLLTIGHAILGLPGDGREGARATAETLREAGCSGVKVHHLMVLERTQFAARWRRGELETLEAETYIAWLADFVERLGPEQVLHRITGDSPGEKLLAPHWGIHKNEIRRGLEAELERRGSRQGASLGRLSQDTSQGRSARIGRKPFRTS